MKRSLQTMNLPGAIQPLDTPSGIPHETRNLISKFRQLVRSNSFLLPLPLPSPPLPFPPFPPPPPPLLPLSFICILPSTSLPMVSTSICIPLPGETHFHSLLFFHLRPLLPSFHSLHDSS